MLRGLLIVVIAQCLLSIPVTWAAEAGTKPVLEIKVVDTLDDLRKQPAIDLGPAGRLHLGIEADSAPVYSGIAVYVLAEDHVPAREKERRDSVGPVWLSVEWAAGPHEIGGLCKQQGPALPRGCYLYSTVIPIEREGAACMRVLGPGLKPLLAEGKLKGVTKTWHPWLPMKFTWGKQGTPLGAEKGSEQGLSYESAGWAVPALSDRSTAVVAGKATIVLPKVLEPQETEGFKITFDGEKLTITMTSEFDLRYLREHFLARWWVNSSAFMPEPAKCADCAEMLDLEGPVRTGRELNLRLDLPAAKLAAHPGDPIGLQLVYCPAGWEYGAFKMAKESLDEFGEGRVFSTSNRVEFKAR